MKFNRPSCSARFLFPGLIIVLNIFSFIYLLYFIFVFNSDVLGLIVRNLCLSLIVFHPNPSPIPIQAFKVLAAWHNVPKTILSYSYITIKFISLTFLWVLFLAHNVSLLKVKFVNFRLNLSLCPRCPEVIRSLIIIIEDTNSRCTAPLRIARCCCWVVYRCFVLPYFVK